MVLLSLLKDYLEPEQQFEKGHPVQLLLYLFNQFGQEAVVVLLNDIEVMLPAMNGECNKLIVRAQNVFNAEHATYQQYQSATAEQKEQIDRETQKKKNQLLKKKKNKLRNRYKTASHTVSTFDDKESKSESEGDDELDPNHNGIKSDNHDDNDSTTDGDTSKMKKQKEWMDPEKFIRCDTLFRKACTKTAPHKYYALRCYMKYLKFLFQCHKFELAAEAQPKLLNLLHDLQKLKKNCASTTTTKNGVHRNNISKLSRRSPANGKVTYKKSSIHPGMSVAAEQLFDSDSVDFHKLETLFIFYYGYLHYLQDDVNTFKEVMQQCIEREPDNIGIRCQYVVCLTSQTEYEQAYVHLIGTLGKLKEQEHDVLRRGRAHHKQQQQQQDSNSTQQLALIKHYRVICGVGTACIRCVYAVDFNMIVEHLQYAMDNDEGKIGVFNYFLSYALYKCGKIAESNDYYNRFVNYVERKKSDALANKTTTKKSGVVTTTITTYDDSNKHNRLIDALSQLNMDFFKWHPDHVVQDKKKASETSWDVWDVLDYLVDFLLVLLVILITHLFTGYIPHFGNHWLEYLLILVLSVVGCYVFTPSLGLFLIAVSLPAYDGNMTDADFNYAQCLIKFIAVSCGMMAVYKGTTGATISLFNRFG